MVNEKAENIEKSTQAVNLPPVITVGELSQIIDIVPSEIIKELMRRGVMANINETINFEMAAIISTTFGVPVLKPKENQADLISKPTLSDTEVMLRPPIVTILGHVDHGKTTLLDSIRGTKVVDSEHGGITQGIGAYQVSHNNNLITFIDTPGHEAFTNMRARGAQVTDIAVLVVAADDGVMPQTIEAINHIKAAGVPMIIAINKVDVPGVDINRLKGQLVEHEVIPEELGGDILCVNVSAIKKEGIEDLLESISLVAEISELKSNPNDLGVGVILEGETDKLKGNLATILVQNGKVFLGNYLVAGDSSGRIKSMIDGFGNPVKSIDPGAPAQVLGINPAPKPGDIFKVFEKEKDSKQFLGKKKNNQSLNVNNFFSSDMDSNSSETFNLIVKTGSQGTMEPVKKVLENVSIDNKNIKIIHSDIGTVNESDIMLATASASTVVAFQSDVEPGALKQAQANNILVKRYDIVYEMIEEIEDIVSSLGEEVVVENKLGEATILEVFDIDKRGKAAGFRVNSGVIKRNGYMKILRDGKELFNGQVGSLRHFKENVREIRNGMEGGVTLENFKDFQENDVIYCYELKKS
ncbi:MAG: translation initiation factor IF-2 [Chloroflexi bacterium]|nr:translation initiation factor IF-2 [Chloroflexota bacterium]|tara:strand:- start:1381 stop:3129 length:1749 start_codon:yes stop_codon:yes gene_type:complete